MVLSSYTRIGFLALHVRDWALQIVVLDFNDPLLRFFRRCGFVYRGD
jgi:hypothetical protein